MPRPSKITQAPPAAVADALARLGRDLRTARLRRRLRLEDLAERVGVSRYVMSDIEKGKPSTAAATYVGALWALGLLNQLETLADPDRDEEGKALERARAPKTARTSRTLDNEF